MSKRTISGADQFTDSITVRNEQFDISIFGNDGFAGTLVVQRQRLTDNPLEDPWRTMKSYDDFSNDIEEVGSVASLFKIRLGCLPGGHIGGSIQVELEGNG